MNTPAMNTSAINKTAIILLSAALTLFAGTSYATSAGDKEGCPAYMKLGDIKGEAMHGNAAPGAGERPNCPKGQLPKMENGMWKCEAMGITAPGEAQRSNANPPPRCPKGQLPKMDNGMWKCMQPGFAAPGNSGDR